MKKKKNLMIGSAMGFLAVLTGEAYCLLNFKGDYVIAIGVGIVLLIMAYLLLDTILDFAGEIQKKEAERNREYSHLAEDAKESRRQQEENENQRLRKGMFVVQRQGFDMLETNMDAMKEEFSTLLKAEIKYERENTKELISNQKKRMDQVTSHLDQMSHDLQKELREVKDALRGENRVQGAKAETPVSAALPEGYQAAVEELRQQVSRITEVLEHIDRGLAAGTVPVQQPEAGLPEETVPEVEPEPVETFSLSEEEIEPEWNLDAEPEEEMTEETDLESLLAELTASDDIVLEDGKIETDRESAKEEEAEEFSEEDLSALISDLMPEIEEGAGEPIPEPEAIPEEEPVPEPEPVPEAIPEPELIPEAELVPEPEPVPEAIPEPEPVPEPEPAPSPAPAANPNKMMSPEEIAALFASMGQ